MKTPPQKTIKKGKNLLNEKKENRKCPY